ncbi:MAG: hypothetical protein D6719_04950 [Candidatus Dadabacteria bacterium]|nr:MAG: hypothetical protein D6719_04950 [Candidatus Dadabacteria bacterium]
MKVALKDIDIKLREVIESIETDTLYTRSASSNFIVLVSESSDSKSINRLLDAISPVHPCRFIAIRPDKKVSDISAEVSASCHKLSRNQHVCSERIILNVPPVGFDALPSVVNAHLLPGVSSELLLFGEDLPDQLINSLSDIADIIYCDSVELQGGVRDALRLLGKVKHIVDLRWIELSYWRQQIKEIFSHKAAASFIPLIKAIHIVTENREGKPPSTPGLLMAGWLSDRLKMSPVAISSSGFECDGPTAGTVIITFEYRKSKFRTRLKNLEIIFDGGNAHVLLERDSSGLHSEVKLLGNEYNFSSPLEEGTPLKMLEKYFVIGESVKNYPAALKLACEMAELDENYRGV